TGTGTATGTKAGVVRTAVKLATGSTVSLSPASKSGSRVAHTGTKVTIKKASKSSSKTVKKATSWIVRAGVGSKKGYSFESVDRKGYYLAAPADGTGTASLLKKSGSASFAKRVTFSAVKGSMGAAVSLRLTARPTSSLKVSGSKLVAGTVGKSMSATMAADFTLPKGLAKR
ncbi:AbfB domain-containing protein, partial [uncultured Amnibacterium sp.]|uniref:AbfB domain-containing protein n=1 Tax=uncultured Amnibacterium sp. TaxID=1631851 RepID=UPI0035C943E4